MNIFLTGDVGVGKSSIIENVLEKSGVAAGGFRTLFFSDRHLAERTLYMEEIDRETALEAAIFSENGKITVNISCFDEFGVSLLNEAEGKDLIIMDELGRFENDAANFKSAVFHSLSGKVPVLGVLRMSYGGWLDEIRARDDVEILLVTDKNRDSLAGIILDMLGFARRSGNV